jgi:hypothetical protein
MRRHLWIRTQRPTFIKAPAYGDLLVLYVVHLKVVLTRTPGTDRARIDERIQDSADGTKAHCKAARGLGLWGVSVEVAALGTFSTATVSSVETA